MISFVTVVDKGLGSIYLSLFDSASFGAPFPSFLSSLVVAFIAIRFSTMPFLHADPALNDTTMNLLVRNAFLIIRLVFLGEDKSLLSLGNSC